MVDRQGNVVEPNICASMLKRQALLMGFWLALSALPAHANTSECAVDSCRHVLVYIGTLGSRPLGPPPRGSQGSTPSVTQADDRPQGIYAARLDEKTGHLAPLGHSIELERATWLLTHPRLPVIYSVAQAGSPDADSDIYTLAVDGASGALHVLGKVSAGGRDATQLALDEPSRTVFSANHGSGDVSALPIRDDGSLGAVASAQKDYGTGPNPRQKNPTAHGVVVDPSHHYVLVADFAADRIFVYHFNAATRDLAPAAIPFEALPPGSGPRHLVFARGSRFLYLTTELSGEIYSYHWKSKSGRLEAVQSLSPYPAGYSGEKSAAEIAVSRNGRYLYVSLRGDQDAIVAYAVNTARGTLREIQRISSQGKTPWSFGIDPTGQWMLVTNEASGSVVELKINPATGELTATNESLSIPKPVTVTFYIP